MVEGVWADVDGVVVGGACGDGDLEGLHLSGEVLVRIAGLSGCGKHEVVFG